MACSWTSFLLTVWLRASINFVQFLPRKAVRRKFVLQTVFVYFPKYANLLGLGGDALFWKLSLAKTRRRALSLVKVVGLGVSCMVIMGLRSCQGGFQGYHWTSVLQCANQVRWQGRTWKSPSSGDFIEVGGWTHSLLTCMRLLKHPLQSQLKKWQGLLQMLHANRLASTMSQVHTLCWCCSKEEWTHGKGRLEKILESGTWDPAMDNQAHRCLAFVLSDTQPSAFWMCGLLPKHPQANAVALRMKDESDNARCHETLLF